MGQGKLAISQSKPNELLTSDLGFGGMGKSNAGFKISPEGSGSKVVWYIDNNFKKTPVAPVVPLVVKDSLVVQVK